MTKTTTKAERKANQLKRHYLAIQALLALCGATNKNHTLQPKTVSNRLRQLEQKYNRLATMYCNGDISTELWDRHSDEAEKTVQGYFNNSLKGLCVNSDARGYTLKIDDEVMRNEYKEIGLQTDWGGYGLLAPEIDGN